MNKLNPTKPAFGRWTKPVKLAIGTLILCLVMLFSGKSIASTIPDSLRVGLVQKIDPKPIRLTEAGARQVLKDKADLIMLQGVVLSQDTLVRQQQEAIASQNVTIRQLNERQQQEKNQGTIAQNQAAHYQTKWRGARLENWLWRVGLVVYVAIRFRLF